tara:strand:- start:4418 stop:5230 length:813 start_codon:yes stop_codon:yes gene_type:complete
MATQRLCGKRKAVDEPSSLDASTNALGACAQSNEDARFDAVKEDILHDPRSTRKLSRDTAFMRGLFSEMRSLEYDRPVDSFETVRLLRVDRDPSSAQSCTVYVKTMPFFFGGCVADLIRMRHVCTIERLIQEDEKRLDLTNAASLRDFLWRFNDSIIEVRQDVLRRLTAFTVIEVRRDVLRRMGHHPKHVSRRLAHIPDRVAALICDSRQELDDDDCKIIDTAFDDNLRDFSHQMMADKENLWQLLTQAGPATGMQAPPRFTICLHMPDA